MVLLINCSVDSMGIESQALEKLDNTRCSMCIVNPIVCTALFYPGHQYYLLVGGPFVIQQGIFVQRQTGSFVLLIFAVLLNCLSEIAIKRGTYE